MVGDGITWLGLDDTDSLDGGCTTEMFYQLLNRIDIEYEDPRLVRLWPFAANRTRGNAAVAVKLLTTFEHAQDLLENQWNWICMRSESDANPALLLVEEQLDESIYWNAVRMNVEPSEIKFSTKHQIWSKGDFGIVGAAAAIAWKGSHDHTWENTVYRLEENIGKTRSIDEALLAEMDKMFPDTFLNRDPRKKKGLISPRSPCPVLLGIRGESAEVVRDAYDWLREKGSIEQSSGNMIWRTNQACDDHLSSIISATVESFPIVRKRGHCALDTSEGKVVAFAEGGDVNKMLQKLIPGDVISFMGLKFEGAIHLEKLRLLKPQLRSKKRPLCECGKRLKSAGKGQKLRCPGCGMLSEKEWIGVSIEPSPWLQPPPDRRRHLASPLERKTPANE